MKTTIGNFATGAVLFAAVSLAPAAANAFMAGAGPTFVGQHFKKMAAELNLSAQQKQEIRATLSNDRDQFLPLLQQLKTEHRKLRSLIQADTIDESAIRAQSAKIAAIKADLAVERAQVGREVRRVLTPDQMQKLKVMQAKRDERRDKAGSRFIKWLDTGE
jgi:periplasmic protein CpxP/Spy